MVETADFADFEQIEGVLAHAGLPEWIKDWSAPAGRRSGRRERDD